MNKTLKWNATCTHGWVLMSSLRKSHHLSLKILQASWIWTFWPKFVQFVIYRKLVAQNLSLLQSSKIDMVYLHVLLITIAFNMMSFCVMGFSFLYVLQECQTMKWQLNETRNKTSSLSIPSRLFFFNKLMVQTCN